MNLRDTEPVRLYLYPIFTAVIALLAFKDIISADEAPFWLAIVASVLAVEGVRKSVFSPSTAKAALETDPTELDD